MGKEETREKLYDLLGELPPRDLPIQSKKVAEEERTSYFLEKWTLNLNGIDPVPAYFVRPLGKNGPFPTVLFNHSHGGKYDLGKDELIKGNTYLQNPPYAEELTDMGYAVLAIDAWGFGSRQGRTESELFKEMLWNGEVLWGKMVYDSLRAIDYLQSRKDVDSNRLATMGISMGSIMSWWIAALNPKIKVCIDMCGQVDFQSLLKDRGLDRHNFYFYVPNLLKHFSTSGINALIAPRHHLSLAGSYDRLTPAEGLTVIDENMKEVYENENASDAWQMKCYNIGHFETAEMRYEVKMFLEKWL